MKQINSGELKSVVDIQSLSETQDSVGDVTSTWTAVDTGVRCKIEPASGTEKMIAGQLKAEVSHKMTLRQSRNYEVKPSMRLVEGSRVFNIVTVLKDESMQRVLTLYCIEVPSV